MNTCAEPQLLTKDAELKQAKILAGVFTRVIELLSRGYKAPFWPFHRR